MKLTRIDVHSHFLPDFYRDALLAAGEDHPDGMPAVPEWSEAEALEMMDQLQIQSSVLSISSPGAHFGRRRKGEAASRQLNEGQEHAFGTPTPVDSVCSPSLRCRMWTWRSTKRSTLDTLHAEGIGVESNHRGFYQGDARLDPFYAELNRRKAALFIHPTSPFCCGWGALALGYPQPMLDFMFETTRAVTHLILSGVTVRFLDIGFVIPRAAAALAVLASRVDGMASLLGKPGEPAPQLRQEMRKLYYDLAGEPLPEALGRCSRLPTRSPTAAWTSWRSGALRVPQPERRS